jgi:cytochrome c oxidase assembly protein Cox11
MPQPTHYRAHITIEFPAFFNIDPDAEANEMVRDIADLLGTRVTVWLDDVTEPDQGQTP